MAWTLGTPVKISDHPFYTTQVDILAAETSATPVPHGGPTSAMLKKPPKITIMPLASGASLTSAGAGLFVVLSTLSPSVLSGCSTVSFMCSSASSGSAYRLIFEFVDQA